jgi:hypothetical protein
MSGVLRVALGATALLAAGLFAATAARAADDWVCGDWSADPTGKCEEVRTCTRTKCKNIEDLTTCQKETRKECVNPKPQPPKPAPRASKVAPAAGELPTTNDPARPPKRKVPASPATGGVNPNN